MRIPDRLQFQPITEDEISTFSQICNEIEDGVHANRNISELLNKWNMRCSREYEQVEFTTYYGAVDTHEFVKEALLQEPVFVGDVRFDELAAVLDAVVSAELPESEHSYYLNLLEKNLPNSNICDLIYWPNEWFNNEALLHLDLSNHQILRYAMLKSGRIIADCPEGIELPIPIPDADPVVLLGPPENPL